MKNKILLTILLALTTVVGYGCGMESEPTREAPESVVEQVTEPETTEEATTEPGTTTFTTTTTATTTTTTTETTTIETTTTAFTVELAAPSFSLDSIPEYSGTPYVEVNGNKPYFTEYPNTQFELYSPHDSLGRCGVAFANICVDIMPTEPRGEIGMVKPSGWHTVRYDDLITDKYLYNRCHLIGFQLAGENANEQNLITGTRYMNVQGMEPFENQVANYVKSYNAHVLYRVTPIF